MSLQKRAWVVGEEASGGAGWGGGVTSRTLPSPAQSGKGEWATGMEGAVKGLARVGAGL